VRHDRPAREPRAGDVNAHHLLEVGRRHLLDRPANVDACGIHEDVDATELARGAGDGGFDLRGVGHIAGQRQARAAVVIGDLRAGDLVALHIAGGDRHLGAGFGEGLADLEPQAAIAAEDEGGLPGEFELIQNRIWHGNVERTG
jgi:hypothetical protein